MCQCTSPAEGPRPGSNPGRRPESAAAHRLGCRRDFSRRLRPRRETAGRGIRTEIFGGQIPRNFCAIFVPGGVFRGALAAITSGRRPAFSHCYVTPERARKGRSRRQGAQLTAARGIANFRPTAIQFSASTLDAGFRPTAQRQPASQPEPLALRPRNSASARLLDAAEAPPFDPIHSTTPPNPSFKCNHFPLTNFINFSASTFAQNRSSHFFKQISRASPENGASLVAALGGDKTLPTTKFHSNLRNAWMGNLTKSP